MPWPLASLTTVIAPPTLVLLARRKMAPGFTVAVPLVMEFAAPLRLSSTPWFTVTGLA